MEKNKTLFHLILNISGIIAIQHCVLEINLVGSGYLTSGEATIISDHSRLSKKVRVFCEQLCLSN